MKQSVQGGTSQHVRVTQQSIHEHRRAVRLTIVHEILGFLRFSKRHLALAAVTFLTEDDPETATVTIEE